MPLRTKCSTALPDAFATFGLGKFTSINWGLWSGSGMVTNEVAQQFASRGVETVDGPRGPASRLAGVSPPRQRGCSGDRRSRSLDRRGRPTGGRGTSAPPPTPLLAGQTVLRRASGMVEARVMLDS